MSRITLFAMVALFPCLCRGEKPGFLNRMITAGGVAYRYVLYVPPSWTPGEKWPVILSLHGSIERGSDGIVQSRVALGAAVRRYPERFPAVIVMPQCRPGVDWIDPTMQAQALGALDAAIKEFNGDPKRVYLTGLSMGGYGAWNLAARYPGRFAALAVVCGGIKWPPEAAMQPLGSGNDNPYARTARAVAHIPIWVFHGDQDRNVPVSESRRMVEALKALRVPVRYTEYPGIAHECWDITYRNPELAAWLLSQRLN